MITSIGLLFGAWLLLRFIHNLVERLGKQFTSRYVHLPKPIVVMVNQVIKDSYVAVRLRLKAYVLDTRYEKAFETDVNLRIMRAFREQRIAPPAILHRSLDNTSRYGQPPDPPV